ncbi:uncharacterized protein LOC119685926 [Teleopsis dalmanni]|uniref:uncharacterized protein LOC119685793 n=1 Tax=Teleopsis dalmanni TaxID=139649 RepID=UPI0018CD3198|nr:uncharacterized protein LOC119685793 [Teleopsis dalmanni]XP_037956261.1 uncharacterized protein LOC119685926 [Teleopsis dalmanni]
MRAFVILSCLSVAYGASLGYDYSRNTAVQSGHDNLSGPISPYNKEFYTFSAPEASFDDGGLNQQLSNSLKKNLRVIFVKGPESSGLENAALQLAKSATDDRTAIYVLQKQADTSQLAQKLNSLNNNNANRPEVHFVKYRTPADAANAQRTIQAQYDNLGGRTSSHNGGVAPVLDFSSKPQNVGVGSVSNFGGLSVPSGTYLPPHKRI